MSMLLVILSVALAGDDPQWSKVVVVRHGRDPVVRFQARLVDGYLLVKATHKKGWHTYSMDNELRAAEALQGKTSLGIEQGIAIKVDSGLELEGAWLQTKPQDFSKPELRWFTYGFEKTALFASRMKAVTGGPVIVRIRGQACSGDTCCKIDVPLELPATSVSVYERPSRIAEVQDLLKGLEPVRLRETPAAQQRPKP